MRTLSAGILPVVLAVALSGCTMFEHGSKYAGSLLGGSSSRSGGLPVMPPVSDTVQLEFIFVERHADDPLLSFQNLWEGMATVGDVTPEIRKRLRENGIRVGLSSSTPNQALETLLGLPSQSSGTTAPVGRQQLAWRRVVRPNGGDTLVQTSRLRPHLRLTVLSPDGEHVKDFENARCVMRVTARRLQQGWAELEFLPEVHHGRLGWRPMSSEEGWRGGTSQKIDPFYSQRFRMKLNIGEMAVITADGVSPQSLGEKFFVRGKDDARMQRVLIVRLANVNPVEANPSR